MELAFFAVGGLAFWILGAVVSLLILVSLDKDNGWGAFLSLVGFCVVFGIWGDGVYGVRWLIANPTYAVGGVGVYLLLGAVWGIAKWALKVRKLARECKGVYQDHRLSFLTSHRDKLGGITVNEDTPVPPQLQKEWIKVPINTREGSFFQQIDRDSQGKIVAPRAKNYKASILLWMSFWPISAVWTVLDDLVKEVFENIYTFLSTWLQSIADRAFANIIGVQEADLVGETPADEGSDLEVE